MEDALTFGGLCKKKIAEIKIELADILVIKGDVWEITVNDSTGTPCIVQGIEKNANDRIFLKVVVSRPHYAQETPQEPVGSAKQKYHVGQHLCAIAHILMCYSTYPMGTLWLTVNWFDSQYIHLIYGNPDFS